MRQRRATSHLSFQDFSIAPQDPNNSRSALYNRGRSTLDISRCDQRNRQASRPGKEIFPKDALIERYLNTERHDEEQNYNFISGSQPNRSAKLCEPPKAKRPCKIAKEATDTNGDPSNTYSNNDHLPQLKDGEVTESRAESGASSSSPASICADDPKLLQERVKLLQERVSEVLSTLPPELQSVGSALLCCLFHSNLKQLFTDYELEQNTEMLRNGLMKSLG